MSKKQAQYLDDLEFLFQEEDMSVDDLSLEPDDLLAGEDEFSFMEEDHEDLYE